MSALPSTDIFLSVVIPAYNEERRLSDTVTSVLSYLRKQSYTWEILIVNDGSTDRTVQVVKQFQKQEPKIMLLEYGSNRGKGYAVRYGMNRARGAYRLFMDADNSTTIDHFEAFYPFFEEGYDIVIGSRDIKGADIVVHQAKIKELLGDLGNLWIRFWAVPGIHDTQAGFKVFRGTAAQAIFPYLTLDGWGFDVEALAVARVRGFSISEQPIRWANAPQSKVKATAYLNVLREVIRVRFNILRGVYTPRGGSHVS